MPRSFDKLDNDEQLIFRWCTPGINGWSSLKKVHRASSGVLTYRPVQHGSSTRAAATGDPAAPQLQISALDFSTLWPHRRGSHQGTIAS
jgi:hypothetical protein